jgi:hypothetical protein
MMSLRQRFSRVISSCGASHGSPDDLAGVVRLAQSDLTRVFSPLISSTGVEALWGRAFSLAQKEYPADERRGEVCAEDDPSQRMRHWLERQAPAIASAAAVEVFAIFAELLITLIGEPLTTRYLQKAWPDEFSDVRPKRKKP